MDYVTKPKVTYRGWGGHFIGGHRCLFRLNTLIEYKDIKIVVSTVGNYMEEINGNRKIRELGFNRYFETMAFHAKKEGEFWEADVAKEISFESPWSYGKDEEWKANKGHWDVVDEICKGLKGGNEYGVCN
jgi:hypothetical protein